MDIWIISAFVAFMNRAALNICKQVLWGFFVYRCCLVPVFFLLFFFGYVLRSRIAGSRHNSIFKVLRNRHTVFQSCCNISHFYQQCLRVQLLHILTIFAFVFHFMANLVCAKGSFILKSPGWSLWTRKLENRCVKDNSPYN